MFVIRGIRSFTNLRVVPYFIWLLTTDVCLSVIVSPHYHVPVMAVEKIVKVKVFWHFSWAALRAHKVILLCHAVIFPFFVCAGDHLSITQQVRKLLQICILFYFYHFNKCKRLLIIVNNSNSDGSSHKSPFPHLHSAVPAPCCSFIHWPGHGE